MGLSIATLLAQYHKVMAVDIVPEKVELINKKRSSIQDDYIEKYLAEKELDLTATLDAEAAYSDADFVVIAAPTNYDSKKNFFDTSAVEAVIKLVIQYNPEAIMVIKSTIPVTAYENQEYCNVQNGGIMAIPDGGPLSSVGQKRGFKNMKRTTGPSLMGEIFKISATEGYRHYFFDKIISKLKRS